MKKLLGVLIIIVVIIVAISFGFYACFSIGTIHTNSAQPIKTNYSNEYKTNFKKDFPYIQDIDIYYQQGRINFNFTVSPQMSLEECKQVVKKTKDILKDRTITESFLKGHNEQNAITICFDSKKDIYSFKCSYFIPTPDTTDNPNVSSINNYKIWYLTVNNQPSVQIEF